MKPRLQRNIWILFLACSALPLTLVTGIGYLSSTRSVESMVLRQTAFSGREIEQRFRRELRHLQDRFLFLASGVSHSARSGPGRVHRTDSGWEFEVEDLLIPARFDRMFSGFLFLEADGRSPAWSGTQRQILDLAALFRRLGHPLVVYQQGDAPWVRRVGRLEVRSLARGDQTGWGPHPSGRAHHRRYGYLL